MDLSGLRETISTREKIFPARSRMVGSVSGKSIIVRRIGPLGRRTKSGASYHYRSKGERRGIGAPGKAPAAAGQFQLQKRLISETMQQTAEATVSRLRWPYFPDCPYTIAVSSARSATRISGSGQKEQEVKKLYIGNLPFSATEEQLNEWFSQVGVTPSGVNLIRDRFTGQSRGFAFVEVTNDEDADRAVNSLNGQNFGGRNLVVNEARPQPQPGRRRVARLGRPRPPAPGPPAVRPRP